MSASKEGSPKFTESWGQPAKTPWVSDSAGLGRETPGSFESPTTFVTGATNPPLGFFLCPWGWCSVGCAGKDPSAPAAAASFSLTASAPEVAIPTAGPKPRPVLWWVPAQREPDREWHRGSALSGEPPSCLFPPRPPSGSFPWPFTWGASTLDKRVCVCDGCCGQLGSADNCRSPSSQPPPTPFLLLGRPGQASPRSPLASPLSADPAVRPQSGCERFGSRYTCWPAVRQWEPLGASGVWLRQPH